MSDFTQLQIQRIADGVATPVDPAARADNPFGTPKTADRELSLAVIEAAPPTPQACWRNAVLAYWPAVDALRRQAADYGYATDAELDKVYYVEGHLNMPLPSGGHFSIDHAWLETGDGRVIETTIREAAEGPDWAFFTGARFTLDEVLHLLNATNNTLPVLPATIKLPRDQADNHRLAYMGAMRAAYWHAWGIDVTSLSGMGLAL